jgi:hypothetical protein
MKRAIAVFGILTMLFAALFVSCGDSLWGDFDNPNDPDKPDSPDGNTYQLRVNVPVGSGTVLLPLGGTAWVNQGSSTYVEVAPSIGYSFDSWSVMSGDCYITSQFSVGTSVTIWNNAVIEANFVPPMPLPQGVWASNVIDTSGHFVWVKVSTLIGNTYNISWDDSYEGSGMYTGDVEVTVYDADGNDIGGGGYDSGYLTPLTITATTTYTYIRVRAYTVGSFAVQYN